jgi:hypothetical protein
MSTFGRQHFQVLQAVVLISHLFILCLFYYSLSCTARLILDLCRPLHQCRQSTPLTNPIEDDILFMEQDKIAFHTSAPGINSWCQTCMNVQTRRCSVDTEWPTQERYNGGPGRKSSKTAVVSVAYLAPETPTGLASTKDLLPYCRVGVFQISGNPLTYYFI